MRVPVRRSTSRLTLQTLQEGVLLTPRRAQSANNAGAGQLDYSFGSFT